MNEPVSFPDAFEKRMKASLTTDWSAFENAHAMASPVSIRLHPRKKTSIPDLRPVPWTSLGFYMKERPVFTLDPLFHAGTYYVQEASSMFLEQAFEQTVSNKESLRVLDLSAAPGGKSTHLAALMDGKGLLVANEVIQSRANILAENIQKWGYPNVLVTNNDPKDFSNLHGFFDVIVVDAPCSGEGLFRRDASAMREWSTNNVDLCAARQTRILHDVWRALKHNGTIIYSTCTYNEKENEDNIIHFLNNHQAQSLPLTIDPSWNVTVIKKDNMTGYRFFPHKVEGEGFFLTVIKKLESEEASFSKPKHRLVKAVRPVVEKLSTWIEMPDRFEFVQHKDLVFVIPKAIEHDIDQLLQSLRLLYVGTNIATMKHEKAIPEHSLATSIIINAENFNCIEVDRKTAIDFLRRDTISVGEQPKGYALLTFSHIPLGWVNVLDNRVNNLYPQEWRIRMTNPN